MRAECSGRLKAQMDTEGSLAVLQELEDWLWSDEGEAADSTGCEERLAAANAKLKELNPGIDK